VVIPCILAVMALCLALMYVAARREIYILNKFVIIQSIIIDNLNKEIRGAKSSIDDILNAYGKGDESDE